MQKVSKYLPTENEIVDFFDSHSGGYTVIRITEWLINGKVNHTTPHDEEWKHVRGILYNLKSKDFLVVENEGKHVTEESFYSTPDRLEKYHHPEVNKTYAIEDNIRQIINTGNINYGNNNKIETLQNVDTQSSLKQLIIAVVAGVVVSLIIGINV